MTPEEEKQAAFALWEKADVILFEIEQVIDAKRNPTKNPIIFEIKQGFYDVRKFRKLLLHWKDLIELL
jgi:hypothetical protein